MAKKTNDVNSLNNANKSNAAGNANAKNPGNSAPKNGARDSAVEKKNPSFSHGPVTSLDLERARKELEKNRIEYKVEKGELYTVDNGDAASRSTAIKLVNGSRRKAG